MNPTPSATPLFYGNVTPLSSQHHAGHGFNEAADASFARSSNVIPVTSDEFGEAHRDYPIVFGIGDSAVPLVLVGLREGSNIFIGEEGRWEVGRYVPAYVRRYPFMLARLTAATEQLTLCYDDHAGLITPEADEKLFAADEPSAVTQRIMAFCEQFEQAAQRTRAFVAALERLELLIEGEASIQRRDLSRPAVFRGFQIVNEKKLQELQPAQTHELVRSGGMRLIYAHLLSLGLLPQLFERQFGAGLANAA
jgi:hypothetical protein